MLKKIVKENWLIIIIILLAFLLRLYFLSPWLEDWDSVQFSLGLHEFNILKHQPHPPGYILYILLGRIFLYFLKTDIKALTVLSSLFGTLSIFITYLLAKTMFNKKVAVLSAVFLSILPVHWVLSEIATSNIPGLFFMTLLLFLTYKDLKSTTNITILGLISGLALGVRATDIPIVAGLLLFCVWKKHTLKYLVYLALGFLFGVCLWFIPVIVKTGFQEFRTANSEIANYVIWHDMLSGKPFTLFGYLHTRIISLSKLLDISYTLPFIILFFISLTFILKQKKIFHQLSFQLLFVYFISYGLPLIFFYNQELAQYTLPLAPVMVIFVALFFNHVWRNLITKIFVLGFIVFLFVNSLLQVNYQKKSIPPTIEPVYFVKGKYKAEETTLITTFIYRQFQYYAPEFKNYYGVANAPKEISSNYVVVDYGSLRSQIPALSGYELINQKSFGPSLNPFVRVNKITLYILKRK